MLNLENTHQTASEALPDLGLTIAGKLAPFAVLAAAGSLAAYFVLTKPKLPRLPDPDRTPVVDVALAQPAQAALRLPSQGILEPVTQTQAVSEVAGKVIWVSPKFHAGERFAAGEEMLKLEPADYTAQVANAQAAVEQAKLQLEMESARSEQAARDWKKLHPNEAPESRLVTREPQVISAKAALESATAALAKAQRDLDRTVLKAPYACRLRKTHADLGSYLTPGTPLADFFGTETFQVRLPLSVADAAWLAGNGESVTLQLDAGQDTRRTLHGKVVRTEGEIDRKNRSFFAVAEIKPSEADLQDLLVAPGIFLQAEIAAKSLENALSVPRAALQGEHVWALDSDQRLQKRTVKVLRAQGTQVYLKEGLKPGEKVLTSTLPVITEGMKVREAAPPSAGQSESASKPLP
jgi:RND family efflux transporter MFP subunit